MSTTDDSLICPITLELFRDPVLAEDGHTYEREAIVQWIERNGRSPLTNQPLSLERLYPNYAIKKLIDRFESSMKNKRYQYILNVDVKRRAGRPLFQTFGKAIYYADWLPTNENRPEIILLKIDGARARKEASFYVDLSRHPHIVRTYGLVYDNNQENNAMMLLQEHAALGSLFDFLQDQVETLKEAILIEIFLQIIDAMIFLAFNGVVHADLACRNVLVFRLDENNPRSLVVKVTDFGLSRHSSLYALAPGAARTTLNIIPVRYVAPELLAANITPDHYTEKSDVYSMGVLMWEAYNRGMIPWANISNDDEVIRRVNNGEFLAKPSNCSDAIWSIICKTWAKAPKDRPTFAQLKYLLTEQSFSSSNPSKVSLTKTLSKSSEEYRRIEREFLDGWPEEYRREIHVEEIHKIDNPTLESKYEQFVHSNPNYATRECLGWHGTSAKCHNGRCMLPTCTLCQIVRNGFRRECARKNTSSYLCWGNATYFSTKSFVCQTYNGGSQIDNTTNRRCTILAKINRGHTIHGKKLIDAWHSQASLSTLITALKYDTVLVARDYYIAPTEYLLLANDLAALPIYIVVYAVQVNSLQVRKGDHQYCSFHQEYHGCNGICDGHYSFSYASCLGNGDLGRHFSCQIDSQETKVQLTASELAEIQRRIMSENAS